MKPLSIFLLLNVTFLTQAQTPNKNFNTLLATIDTLRAVVNSATSASSEDTLAVYKSDRVATALAGVFRCRQAFTYNLDSLLLNERYYMVHTQNKQLWMFCWTANNFGTFQMSCHLFVYNNPQKGLQLYIDQGGNRENETATINYNDYLFNASQLCNEYRGAWFSEIYRLPSSKNKLYLLIGSVVGCATCCEKVAAVVELTSDGINFSYPAFSSENGNSPCFSVDARCGNIEAFDYNPKTGTLRYSYIKGDATPDSESDSEKVRGSMRFNGVAFY